MNNTDLYAPIQEDLRLVESKLSGIAEQAPHSPQVFAGNLLGHVLEAPGKRTRPAITLLAAKLHAHDNDSPQIMAAAVELLHIATLIHDDTVDNSAVRRGLATVSSSWGENVAVLLGDYVFATSATFVCETNNIRVIKRFSETIMELSSGELSEILDAYKPIISREPYWRRIYHKTASLFCTSAESGAVLSDAPENQVQSLKSYGYNVGMAFQIVDDILDFHGTEEEIKKPVGNDLLQGTLTLPSIMLMEQYPDDNPVKRVFENGNSENDLEKAIDMVQNSTIISQSYDIANEFCNRALESLEGFPDSDSKNSLSNLASYIMSRRQ